MRHPFASALRRATLTLTLLCAGLAAMPAANAANGPSDNRQQAAAMTEQLLQLQRRLDRVSGSERASLLQQLQQKAAERQHLLAELAAANPAAALRASLPAFGPSPQVPAPPPAPGTLRLDPVLPRAWLGNEVIDLTQREWSLLDLLVSHSGQVVSREDVLAAWQSVGAPASPHPSPQVFHLIMKRRKLAGSTLNIRNIRGLGLRGLGYLLEATAA